MKKKLPLSLSIALKYRHWLDCPLCGVRMGQSKQGLHFECPICRSVFKVCIDVNMRQYVIDRLRQRRWEPKKG